MTRSVTTCSSGWEQHLCTSSWSGNLEGRPRQSTCQCSTLPCSTWSSWWGKSPGSPQRGRSDLLPVASCKWSQPRSGACWRRSSTDCRRWGWGWTIPGPACGCRRCTRSTSAPARWPAGPRASAPPPRKPGSPPRCSWCIQSQEGHLRVPEDHGARRSPLALLPSLLALSHALRIFRRAAVFFLQPPPPCCSFPRQRSPRRAQKHWECPSNCEEGFKNISRTEPLSPFGPSEGEQVILRNCTPEIPNYQPKACKQFTERIALSFSLAFSLSCSPLPSPPTLTPFQAECNLLFMITDKNPINGLKHAHCWWFANVIMSFPLHNPSPSPCNCDQTFLKRNPMLLFNWFSH